MVVYFNRFLFASLSGNKHVAAISRAATPSERRLAFLDLDVPRQGYNDEDKANALLVLETCGDDHAAAARATGIPYRTLYEWGRLGRVSQAALDIKAGKREVLADKLEALAHQLVDAAPKKIKRAGLAQTMVAAGVAVDKMRLLREQPTDIHRTENLTDEQRAERIAALIAVVCGRDDDGGNPLAFGDDAGEREGGNRQAALPAGDEGF